MKNNFSGLLSVIVLVYKSEIYVRDTLESLINQTNNDFEIVIVDNGSIDSSMKIVREILESQQKISYQIVALEKNIGCGQGRRAGFEAAKGRYVVYVDSDDTVKEDFSDLLLKAIESKPDVIVFGRNNCYKDGRIIEVKPEPVKYVKYYLDSFSRYCINKCVVINNKIDFSDGSIGEDRVFGIRLSKYISKVVLVNAGIYNFRLNAESTTQNVDWQTILEGKRRVFVAFQNAINSAESLRDKHFYYIRAYSYFLCSLAKDVGITKELEDVFKTIFLKEIKEPIIPFMCVGDKKSIPWIRKIMLYKLKIRG